MTAKEYQSIWHKLIDERFSESWESAIADKLKRIKFDQHGHMKKSKESDFANEKQSHLVDIYKIRSQATEIPKRKMRTRPEHHSPKRDQMNMFKGNQLDLF